MIQEAKEAWNALEGFRKNRNRCIDYTFGRQWNDKIHIDGRTITEYEYILREGNIPLKNNLIRRIVRNVLGVFRKQLPEMLKIYGEELQGVVEENSLEELYARTMEEFLISGMAVHRKGFGIRGGKRGIFTDPVSPRDFFFSTSSYDVRGRDINLIGQFHTVDFREWCEAFVTDPESYGKARKLFTYGDRRRKITELWRRELRPRYILHHEGKRVVSKCDDLSEVNQAKNHKKRWILDDVWRYYFLSEDGTVLCEGDSPYQHRSHPYIVKCYPFLDGEIHSFVADMIDQQRYANRLITLYDWVIRASAKGVLLLPKGAVEPEELQYVADQWSRFNGVILYKSQAGVADPHQVSGNTQNIGISELLEIQLKMLEDVSGVTGTLQGNLSGNSVSGTLYNQQTQNALTSLSDLMATYEDFIKACRDKDQSLLQQTNFT